MRKLAIFLILLFASPCFAFSPVYLSTFTNGADAPTCQVNTGIGCSSSQADFNTLSGTAGNDYIQVKANGAHTVCKVVISLAMYESSSGTHTIRYYSSDGTTPIGDASDAVTVDSSSYLDKEFTWSGTPPSVSDVDYRIVILRGTGIANIGLVNSDVCYEDGSYSVFAYGGDLDEDARFQEYSMQ